MNKFGIFLIVLSVGILVGAVFYIVNPLKTLNKRDDVTRIQDLKQVAQAIEHYHRDYGSYPHTNSDYIIVTGEEAHPWGFAWMPYISKLPQDPASSKRYVYWADETDNYQSFRLYASLAEPGAVLGSCESGKECRGVPAANLCGASSPCNFGVTSSNISP